jgi:serine/threonine protein kinase
MKPPNWDRIQEIYHAALELPPSERDAFVANACAGEADLQREVESLLKAAESRNSFLDSPVVELNSEPDSLAGTTINGRYHVESELSRSRMSQVHLARDQNLQGQTVVVKVLSHELVQDSEARRRFDKEVEALLRMDHPNVVRLLDSGEMADGRPYIVMPYVDGEQLRTQMPPEGMDLERAAEILKQIGPALDHVHENEIFHRDLKPENVLLKRGTDSVVLIDFGIAKVRGSLVGPSTVDGPAVGTLVYMSPEQLRGEKITAASDVYSLAVVAYEMVTGQRPFKPKTAAQLLEMQRAGPRLRPMQHRENLPVQADRIITRALKFEARARCQSAGKFCDELSHALLDTRKPTSTRVPTWAKVIAGLIVAVLLSFGMYKYFGGRGDTGPNRSFKYFLTVQGMRNGQPYRDSFKSHGDETFNRDDNFRLTVSTLVPAYLYIFKEKPPAPNETSFTMIYPRPTINNGSASLGPDQSVDSDWYTFRGPPGAENFWIVWSTSPVRELDSAISEANKHPDGGLTGETLVTVKQYLMAKKSEIDATTFNYKESKTAVVRGKSDLLVTLAQFKHR